MNCAGLSAMPRAFCARVTGAGRSERAARAVSQPPPPSKDEERTEAREEDP